MRSHVPALLLAMSVAASGCEDELLGFGSGIADATVRDDTPTSGGVSGSLSGNVQVSFSDNGATWAELDSPVSLTIPLQTGSSTIVHEEQDVAVGSYSRVRLTFIGVTAQLAAGSIIGGTTLTSAATVAIGGADQRIDIVVTVAPFSVELAPAGKRIVIFDLNSELWLTLAAVQAGAVDDAAIQAAVTAQVQQGPPR